MFTTPLRSEHVPPSAASTNGTEIKTVCVSSSIACSSTRQPPLLDEQRPELERSRAHHHEQDHDRLEDVADLLRHALLDRLPALGEQREQKRRRRHEQRLVPREQRDRDPEVALVGRE